jgi:DHA3 family macrolide efflux protein-like MFS transporter
MNKLFSSLLCGEFRKYMAATALTSIGNGMHFIAMSWFLYHITGKVASVGWILIVSTLPGLLFSPWIGVLVDRWSNKWVCVVTDLVRGLLLACMALAMYFDAWVVETIYVTTFLAAVCSMFFQPSVAALIRDISAKGNLLDANIVSNMSMQIGMLAGSSIGGLLIAQFGVMTVVVLNVASFFISGCLTLWIRQHGQAGAHPAAGKKIDFTQELRDTLAYVRDNRFIVWFAVVQMLGSVTLYVCNTLLPVFVDRELKAGAQAFGIIDAGWGAGAIAGGLALAYIARRIKAHRISMFGPVFLSAAILLFLTSHNVVQAVAGYFALAFVICVVRVSTDTEIAAEVDRRYFGKIKSTIIMFVSYISLGVYGLVGYLGDHISVRWIFLALSMAMLGGFLLNLARGRWFANIARARRVS